MCTGYLENDSLHGRLQEQEFAFFDYGRLKGPTSL
jgi:hypothetical protein